ncbi:MAG: ComEC/Rec2 family competence protein [Opitutaceae bacterium]
MKTHLARAAVLAFVVLLPAVCADQKTKTLDVYWVDSEGGGSTLIVTPNNESVLIDTGNPGGRDPARIIAAAKAAGLTKIDHVFITHWHVDHFGGAAEVAAQVPFGTLYQRAIPEGDPDGRAQSTFQVQIKPFRDIAAKREPLKAGAIIPLGKPSGSGAPKLELRCLGADQTFVAPTAEQQRRKNPLTGSVPAKAPDKSDNANSAVFLLSFGAFRFFDGGDLTWNLEEKLVTPYNLPGVVDVYQTNHLGLEVSNNPVLVQSLEPTVVVMNNGPKKGGQPGTFAAIRSAKSVQALYQVHKSFNVPEAENTAHELTANHENLTGAAAAQCPANMIKMSVAPDGKSYTISVPSTGHSKTYRTKGR